MSGKSTNQRRQVKQAKPHPTLKFLFYFDPKKNYLCFDDSKNKALNILFLENGKKRKKGNTIFTRKNPNQLKTNKAFLKNKFGIFMSTKIT